MVTVSALATTLFLGGWRAPWPISLWPGANEGWLPLLWFFGKVLVFIFVFVWLRGTLPRLRYDQFMKLGWKVLIPVSLVWIVAVAAVRVVRTQGVDLTRLVIGIGVVAAVVAAGLVHRRGAGHQAGRRPAQGPAEGVRPVRRRVPGAAAVRGDDPSRRPSSCLRARSARTTRPSLKTRSLRWLTSRSRAAASGSPSGPCSRRSSPSSTREEHKPTAPRFHGRHQLNRHPDGLEKCIGCELCAWACPADAIYVEGAPNTEDERFSPGERYGRVYQINYLRCIFCGLCIEACPTRALTMTNEYELADDTRAEPHLREAGPAGAAAARACWRRRTRWSPGTTEKRLLPRAR